MEIAIILILYLFVILFDFIPVIKKQKKNEIWVYAAFLTVSFACVILFNKNKNIPSLATIFTSIGEALLSLK